MRLIRKNEVKFRGQENEERVAILVGRHEVHGASKHCTLALVELAPGVSSHPHFHKEREESYFILGGTGKAIIGNEEVKIQEHDCLFAGPGEKHQFINTGTSLLRYLVMTAPAWIPEDSHLEA